MRQLPASVKQAIESQDPGALTRVLANPELAIEDERPAIIAIRDSMEAGFMAFAGAVGITERRDAPAPR